MLVNDQYTILTNFNIKVILYNIIQNGKYIIQKTDLSNYYTN